jgi:diguanylate cyclase (GGDEF)-like protein
MAGGPTDARAMAHSAAMMFAGAALVGVVQSLTPGGPEFAIAPSIAALLLALLLAFAGPRLPRPALVALGPIGTGMIGVALATTHGYGDGAVMYVWPVLWVGYFFGRRATGAMVAWIGVVHAVSLTAMPADMGYPDRWVDVMVTVTIVAVVVRALAERNERLVARLVAEARVDVLTGLLNRRGFEESLALELARAEREGRSVAVVSFDVDDFKRVNDERGHEVGDRVLARLGTILREQARAIDLVARLGGDEFVAVLPSTDAAGACAFAQRVRRALASERSSDLGMTVSAGISEGAAAGPAATLGAADRALYAAKRAGRDRVVVDTDETTGLAPV